MLLTQPNSRGGMPLRYPFRGIFNFDASWTFPAVICHAVGQQLLKGKSKVEKEQEDEVVVVVVAQDVGGREIVSAV